MKIKSLHIILFLVCCCACRESYQIPDSQRTINMLVVEGHLDNGGEQTIIRLSRTIDVEDTAMVNPETGAEVYVSDGNSQQFLFTEINPGEYIFNRLQLNQLGYRLHITTRDRQQYLSDIIPVKDAPEVDSLSWRRGNNGVNIFVSTHDPQNNSRYYRWEFEETWALISTYPSLFEYRDLRIIPRADPNAIFYCWASEKSTRTITASSAKLSDDLISMLPVTEVQTGAVKLSVRYSILVKQFALTDDAYAYWDILKKNTEQVGTLFDPQPSQLKSNIHGVTNPAAQVIGYVSAGRVTEKRLFISRSEVHPWNYIPECREFTVPSDSVRFFFGPGKPYMPTTEWRVMDRLIGYYASTTQCVDCTLSGTNMKPAFW